MPIVVRGLTLGLDESEELLKERAAARLRVKANDIRAWAIIRRALDARRHDRLAFTYNDTPMELRRGLYRTDTHHYRNDLS